ncbi:MAG: ABC transporter permease, partial [Phycisphaerae bacterium]|nr:ABC transporter permease [Saprospiraceae bacterium]
MSHPMLYLRRGLGAELLKYQRTPALLLAIGAPFLIVLLNFCIFYFKGHVFLQPKKDPWLEFWLNNLYPTTQVLFPLYVILVTVLIHQLEHQAHTMKLIYALPMPKWTVYLGKVILTLFLTALSILLFAFFILLAGKLLGIFKPDLRFGRYDPRLGEGLGIVLRVYLASLAMVALQFW